MRPILALAVVSLFALFSLHAQTTWTGATNTNWFEPTNWNNGVPVSGQLATIPAVSPNQPAINTPYVIDFPVENYGILTLTANVSNVSNFLNGGGGFIENSGLFTNELGALLDNDGTFNNYNAFENYGFVDNSGIFQGGVGDSFINQTLGTFINNGLFSLTTLFSNAGNFTNGNLFFNLGIMSNAGIFSSTFGSSLTNGLFLLGPIPGTILNTGTFSMDGTLFNNLGSITNGSNFQMSSSGVLNNNAPFNNNSNFLNAGQINNSHNFFNNGILTNDFGSNFDNSAGTLTNGSCDYIYHQTANPIGNAGGTVANNGVIYAVGSGVVVNSGSGVVLNSFATLPSPTAQCNGPFVLTLDNNDEAQLTPAQVNNGSSAPYCAIELLSLSQADFDCSDIGTQTVVLTVTDSLGFSAQCSTQVTVLDTVNPVIVCPGNMIVNLAPFECGATINFNVTATDNCTANVVITQTDATGLQSGDEFPIGLTTLTFEANDGNGNTSSCSFTIQVNEYRPPSNALLCNDNGQLSLSSDCVDPIDPRMVLMGAYGCADDFLVTIMGRNNNLVDTNDIGRRLMVRVLNTETGVACMGEIVVQDKQAPVIDSCLNDTLWCVQNPRPSFENGEALTPVISDCSDFSSYYFDEITKYGCDSVFSQKITRTWIASDEYDNHDTCVQMIWIRRINLADLSPTCPENYEVECMSGVSRDLSPATTGYPTIILDGRTFSLRDTVCDACGLLSDANDDTLSSCGSSVKILREWRIFDWCAPTGAGNPWSCLQTVKLADSTPPVIPPFPAISLGVSTDDCTSFANLPPANISDCSQVSVRILTPIGVINSNGGPLPAPGLGAGDHIVTYLATDACGNTSSRTATVSIRDTRPPVPVCETFTTVSITSDGTARVFATSLDQGSVDECCIDRFAVRRMATPCGIAADTTFRDYVNFCCSDVGEDVMVVLRVYDCAGNFNDCMVTVSVDNKLNPVLVCPGDVVLNCGDDINNLALTGNIVTNPALRGPRDGIATSNCNGLTITRRDSMDLRCGLGTIFRIWTATDADGDRTMCTQRITLRNPVPFNGNNIIWPRDTAFYNCFAVVDTSVTGRPIYNSDACSQVLSTFNDDTLRLFDGSCYKVLRTWIVIDWCQYQPNVTPVVGRWEHIQQIKVYDTGNPVIDLCQNRVFCNEDDRCQPLPVDLSVMVSDSCTPANQLSVSWVVDAFADGIPDTGPQFQGSGQNTGNSYGVGTHEICYTVSDHCGNQTVCCYLFKILDCKAPTAVCANGLSTSLMANGMVTLPARYFDASSNDNCAPAGNLMFSFSSNVEDSTRTFTCMNVGINSVDLWVTDENGNQAFCTTFIDIQDNMGICPNTKIAIGGIVKDPNGQGVSPVKVQVNGQGTTSMMTDDDGVFIFDNLPSGDDYTVAPSRNDDPLNGVTTFDLVLMQKHILNVQKLDSPYKIIAADVNKSSSVTTFDVVLLRKLILRVDSHFTNNSSWRFIDKKFRFPNASNPFATNFPEVINRNNLTDDELAADFVAVKIGDVNGSARPNNFTSIDDRSYHGDFTIIADNPYLHKGDLFTIRFNADKNESLLGCQFTLDFDPRTLELVEVQSGELVDQNNFGLALLDDGAITFSWDNSKLQPLLKAQAFFSLQFVALEEGSLNQWLSLSSRYARSEAYTENGEVKNVLLQFADGSAGNEGYALYQNKPNPFSDETVVGFNLPEFAPVTLTVTDVSGKTLQILKGNFGKGYGEFRIDKSVFGTGGVLYYRLDTPKFSDTKKMILIR